MSPEEAIQCPCCRRLYLPELIPEVKEYGKCWLCHLVEIDEEARLAGK